VGHDDCEGGKLMMTRKIALVGAVMAAIGVSILLTAHARAEISSAAYPPSGPVGGVLAGSLPYPSYAAGSVDFNAIRTLAPDTVLCNPTAGVTQTQACPLGNGLFFSSGALSASGTNFGNATLLTGSGNFIVAAGVTNLLVCLQGQGGGGGGVSTAAAAAAGGSSGETKCALYAVTPGASIAYNNFNAGGQGGAAGASGTNGSYVTFGTLTAGGGWHGAGSVGGNAGASSTFQIWGQQSPTPWGTGVFILSDTITAGQGGATGQGGAGGPTASEAGAAGGANAAGVNAASGAGQCGAGGGGASETGAGSLTGGAGGPSCIVVMY
jgi:hypothetical protein